METLLERLIVTFVGSLLGFVFAVVIWRWKEKNDERDRLCEGIQALILFAELLKNTLIVKRGDSYGLDIGFIMKHYDVLSKDRILADSFKTLFWILARWNNKVFDEQDVKAEQDGIEKIIKTVRGVDCRGNTNMADSIKSIFGCLC
ncbi:MAG: hypothetical protein HQL95_06005 [Magnetococcales bacterium]|nr:hypothetical protein [Magnetococcales bacterium]